MTDTRVAREQIAEMLWNAASDGDDPEWTWAYLTERADKKIGDYDDMRAVYYREADAVLALIDKENTMPDDITPEQRASLDRGMQQSNDGETVDPGDFSQYLVPDDKVLVERALPTAEQIGEALFDLHILKPNQVDEIKRAMLALLDPPKPPASRLRVVNLDELISVAQRNIETTMQDVIDRLEAQPDLLTTLDAAVDGWYDDSDAGDRTDLKSRIHAAMEVIA